MTKGRIIKNIFKATAKKLIGHLKDYTGVSWNTKVEMVIDGKTLPHYDIRVPVNNILRKAKQDVDPVGRKFLM